jgi:hypothetical protein
MVKVLSDELAVKRNVVGRLSERIQEVSTQHKVRIRWNIWHIYNLERKRAIFGESNTDKLDEVTNGKRTKGR